MLALSHLSRDDLRAHALGRLSRQQSAAVEGHLKECALCASQRAAIDGCADSFVELLQTPPADLSEGDASVMRLIARAQDLLKERTQTQSPADAPPPARPVPQRVAGFEVKRELTAGGLGVVYLVHNPEISRDQAVKLLLPENRGHTEYLARFEREKRAIARVRDKQHVVEIFHAGIDPDPALGPYLVMEYLNGGSLKELLGRHGPLPPSVACELVRQAALALDAVHSQGLVHRDVKPSNLMLVLLGVDKAFLKLIDFGLVKEITGETGSPAEATTGGAMGTHDYMAPEQAGMYSKVPVGTAADIYSLGCTLFALLNGQPPFEGRSVKEKLKGHATEAPPRLSRSDLSPEVIALMNAMLDKNPGLRPSAATVATRLAPFGCDPARLRALLAPMAAPTPPRQSPHRQPRSRHTARGWLAVAAVCAVLLLAALVMRQIVPVFGTTPDENHKPVGDANTGNASLDSGDAGSQRLKDKQPTTPPTDKATEKKPAGPDDGPVGEIAPSMSGFVGKPRSVRFSPSTHFAVTSERVAIADPLLRLWDLQKRKEINHWAQGSAMAVFTPDERFVASGVWPGGALARQIILTDPKTGNTVGKLPLPDPNYMSYDLSFSRDGKLFLTPGYYDGFVRVWQFAAGKQHRAFKHGKSANTACFTTDDILVLSGGDDNFVRLWDIENDRQEKSYEGHEKPLKLVRALADGKRFVSVCADWKVIVWDLKSGKRIHELTLEDVGGNLADDTPLAVAPKGRRLLVGHKDGSISFWDLDTGKSAGKLEGHKKGAVVAVDISADGRFALSAGEDLTLRYWRLPAVTPLRDGTDTLPKVINDKK